MAERVRDGATMDPDKGLSGRLEDLRQAVDNRGGPRIVGYGDTFRELDSKQFRWIAYDNLRFGYRSREVLIAGSPFLQREIAVGLPGADLDELSPAERKRIIASIAGVFLDQGSGMPEISSPSADSMIIRQNCAMFYQYEANPNIVTPGKVG